MKTYSDVHWLSPSVEYIESFQDNTSLLGLLNDMYLCISCSLIRVSIDCLYQVEYIDIFQEIKSLFWLPNDFYLYILCKIVRMSNDCLHHEEYIDIFLESKSRFLLQKKPV